MSRPKRIFVWLIGALVVVAATWAMAIGPVTAWRVATHGTTTIWDHLEYPGHSLTRSSRPDEWEAAPEPMSPPDIMVGDMAVSLESLLAERDALSFVVIHDGAIVYEWYAPGHAIETPSMVFSVTKSIFALLFGAAVDDALVGSVHDPVTRWVPELGVRGFAGVTLEDLLRMDSNTDYVENDNPFGVHVEFNYTDDLPGSILGMRVSQRPDPVFRYKSGDNALLGLVLHRALAGRSITAYMQDRMWDPLGMEHPGVWSTDREDGLERTWCCLAMTARDLARFGQLILDGGAWKGESVVSAEWLDESFRPGYPADRWPEEYGDSPLVNYGYQWWLTNDAVVAIGKDGQYLYVDRGRQVAIVRLGESQGGIGWVDVLRQVAEAAG